MNFTGYKYYKSSYLEVLMLKSLSFTTEELFVPLVVLDSKKQYLTKAEIRCIRKTIYNYNLMEATPLNIAYNTGGFFV